MSILRNLIGVFMPHFESRRTAPVTLAANNAEVVHNVDGDEHALIFINGSGTPNLTYQLDASPDGVNYFPVLAFPLPQACVGGTIPQAGQPLITEALSGVATVQRTLLVPVGGMQKLRARVTPYTAGSLAININSDAQASMSPYIRDQKACTLMVSNTGVASAAVTATLPAVAGLRHYVDRVSVVRSATALLTAAATPALVTATNLPGGPVLSFGQDAAAQGGDKELVHDFGGAGMAATAINTATTIVCPVYTGVIWRVNVSYRLGL